MLLIAWTLLMFTFFCCCSHVILIFYTLSCWDLRNSENILNLKWRHLDRFQWVNLRSQQKQNCWKLSGAEKKINHRRETFFCFLVVSRKIWIEAVVTIRNRSGSTSFETHSRIFFLLVLHSLLLEGVWSLDAVNIAKLEWAQAIFFEASPVLFEVTKRAFWIAVENRHGCWANNPTRLPVFTALD